MLVYVFIKPTYLTSDVITFDDQQVIFCTFLQITSELKEIVYYSKWPISLLFYAFLHETIKHYCQCPLKLNIYESIFRIGKCNIILFETSGYGRFFSERIKILSYAL